LDAVRTTLNLPDDLMAQLKKTAAESGRTVTAVVEEALRSALARRRRRGPSVPATLTTFGEGGVQPGVDLDDTASVLDLMEAPPGPGGR
jgi:plasmid stability protein